jgi:hypothetical protein
VLRISGERTKAAFGGVQVAGGLGRAPSLRLARPRQRRAATTAPLSAPVPAVSMIAVIFGASASNERARRAA